MSTPATFRVHFIDGFKLDVTAASAADARKQAKGQRDGIVVKIKRVRP